MRAAAVGAARTGRLGMVRGVQRGAVGQWAAAEGAPPRPKAGRRARAAARRRLGRCARCGATAAKQQQRAGRVTDLSPGRACSGLLGLLRLRFFRKELKPFKEEKMTGSGVVSANAFAPDPVLSQANKKMCLVKKKGREKSSFAAVEPAEVWEATAGAGRLPDQRWGHAQAYHIARSPQPWTRSESKGENTGTEYAVHKRCQMPWHFPNRATHQLPKWSDSFKDQSGNSGPGQTDLQLPHPHPCAQPNSGIGE